MEKVADSDEDEIWNYKSLTKERSQFNKLYAVQEGIPGRKLKFGKPTDRNKKADIVAEVINVDLEPVNEFVSPKVSVARNGQNINNKMSQNNSKVKTKISANVKSGSTTYKAKGKLSSNKPRSNNKKVKPKMVALMSSKLTKSSDSPSKNKSETPECHNIDRYFSPTSDKRKKRKSSESVDRLFDFTDDELIFVQEEKIEPVCEIEMKIHDKSLTSNATHSCCSAEGNIGSQMKCDSFISSSVAHEDMSLTNVVRDSRNIPTSSETVSPNVVSGECNVVINIESTDIPATSEDGDNIVVERAESNLHECDENTPYKYISVEGGFLIDGDEYGFVSINEDDKLRDKCEVQSFSSSSDSSDSNKLSLMSQEHDIHLVKVGASTSVMSKSFSDETISKAVAVEEKCDGIRRQSVAQDTSPRFDGKNGLVTSAQKQTSIFSFFKAQYGSHSTSSKSLNNKFFVSSNSPQAKKTLPNSLSETMAKPNVHNRNTVSTTKSPVLTTKDYQKQFRNSTPALAVGKKSPEQPKNNARIKKQCPFYKKIPDTTITVDAFSYGVIPGCEAYVLTHFHYDHYGGLTKRFAQPIYCSQVTGNLVEQRLGVDKKWINPLPLWKPCQVAGVILTLMEANHCPGAVMILFELKGGRKILHTGDFRACSEMEEYPMLKEIVTSDLFLDTTYCNPTYTFPVQSDVINFVVSLVLTFVAENSQTLIVCGTYTIGKEKIFTAIARALDSKICVTKDKKKVLDCLGDKELQSRLTLDWSEGQVHVLPMAKLNQKALFDHHACHSHFQSVLAFEPTGWTFNGKTSLANLGPKWSKNGVTLYGLPYSEHSSYLELKRFIQFLRPKRIIPTVNNGKPEARKKMEDTFSQWMLESHTKTCSGTPQQRKLNSWIS